MITADFFLITGGIVFLSGTAFAALCWAVKDRQFGDLSGAPLTIFDADEPVGVSTDKFPSRK